jgi:replicative DNA helicase
MNKVKYERNSEGFIAPAEFQLLKLMLLNNKKYDSISELNFPHHKAKALYAALVLLIERSEKINKNSLLREASQFDDDIDQSLIEFLYNFEVDETNLDGAIEALADSALKSKIGNFISNISQVIKSKDKLNLNRIGQDILNIQDIIIGNTNKSISKTFGQCADEYKLELDLRKSGHYYSFNDEFLDSHLTKKAAPGQVILLASSSGTGKSAYGLNLINGMINLNSPVMYFSLEMDTISTMDRLMAMRSGIPVSEWYSSGAKIDPLYKILEEQKELLKDKPYRFIDDPAINLLKMRSSIREFKSIYKTKYVCVFVDLITQVKEFIDLSKGSLANTIEASVNKLNKLAKQEDVCIVAIAQMNRGADSKEISKIEDIHTLRPTYNNIKNSSALGERSRVVLSAFRGKYYAQRLFPEDPQTETMPDILEIQILKQSQGKVGDIGRYLFIGETFNISPTVEDIEESILPGVEF